MTLVMQEMYVSVPYLYKKNVSVPLLLLDEYGFAIMIVLGK